MITSITIENLRGIAEGSLEGLAPLTVLTGPNASGKSTVLDALLIGANPEIESATGEAVARHRLGSGGARWLVGRAGKSARIGLVDSSNKTWTRVLQWADHCDGNLQDELVKRRGQRPFSSITVKEDGTVDAAAQVSVGFSSDDQFVGRWSGAAGLSTISGVTLVDAGSPARLHRKYSVAVKAGCEALVEEPLRSLLPSFERFQILVGDRDVPELFILEGKKVVPVPLAGDGIQAFAQLVLETSSASDGLILIEEPEACQHPKAIRATAEILLETARRGVQIVLTTHSLELIDALIEEATAEDLEFAALFNLSLDGGRLISSRRSGNEMAFARREMETDLR